LTEIYEFYMFITAEEQIEANGTHQTQKLSADQNIVCVLPV